MKRSTILIIVILLLAVGGWYGYKLYTGKVKSLTEVKADASITATDLIKAFEKDSAAANGQYLGKILEVSGTTKTVENEDKSATIVLGEEGNMSGIRCSMDSNFVQKAAQLKQGSKTIVRGACTGFNADEMLGSDVILNRCILVENK